MEQLKWERQESGVFRRVCNGWRDAHDQCVRHLSVNTWLSANACRFNSAIMMSCFILRFPRAKQMDVRGDPLHRPDVAEEGSGADKWHGCGHWAASLASPTSTCVVAVKCQTTGCRNWAASLPSPASTCVVAGKWQTTGCRHLPASLPSPASSCAAVTNCQTTGCGHWLPSLPSSTSTCAVVAECQMTGCGYCWPASPPSPASEEEEDDPRVGGQWRIATLSRRGKCSPAAGT
jgi:hypothetical protein